MRQPLVVIAVVVLISLLFFYDIHTSRVIGRLWRGRFGMTDGYSAAHNNLISNVMPIAQRNDATSTSTYQMSETPKKSRWPTKRDC